jgi:hypothetical protein
LLSGPNEPANKSNQAQCTEPGKEVELGQAGARQGQQAARPGEFASEKLHIEKENGSQRLVTRARIQEEPRDQEKSGEARQFQPKAERPFDNRRGRRRRPLLS